MPDLQRQELPPDSEEKTIGLGVMFERIRRITGYLSKLERFCDAKDAEEKARVKHTGNIKKGDLL